jgi:hypothetical protein
MTTMLVEDFTRSPKFIYFLITKTKRWVGGGCIVGDLPLGVSLLLRTSYGGKLLYKSPQLIYPLVWQDIASASRGGLQGMLQGLWSIIIMYFCI